MEILPDYFDWKMFVCDSSSDGFIRISILCDTFNFSVDILETNYFLVKRYVHTVGVPPFYPNYAKNITCSEDLLSFLWRVNFPLVQKK